LNKDLFERVNRNEGAFDRILNFTPATMRLLESSVYKAGYASMILAIEFEG